MTDDDFQFLIKLCVALLEIQRVAEVVGEAPELLILTNSSKPVVVVVLLHLVVGPGSRDAADVPHQWLVVRPGLVVEAPAVVAEVVEAGLLSTEVRPLLHGAHAT